MAGQYSEKSFLDWTRNSNPRIQARGIASILTAKIKTTTTVQPATAGSTRCVWPSERGMASTRQLSKRVW